MELDDSRSDGLRRGMVTGNLTHLTGTFCGESSAMVFHCPDGVMFDSDRIVFIKFPPNKESNTSRERTSDTQIDFNKTTSLHVQQALKSPHQSRMRFILEGLCSECILDFLLGSRSQTFRRSTNPRTERG